MPPRVLVAGIGNIFLGDEVARRLAGPGLPDGVRVVDFGIRGLDLDYALLDGYEAVILIDATPRGGRPGTLCVLGLPNDAGGALVEAHALDPARVLCLAASLGARVGRLILVGCEPSPIDESEGFGAGPSAPALAAVDGAVSPIPPLVGRLLRGEGPSASGDDTRFQEEARSCRG